MNKPWFKLYAADTLMDSKLDEIPLEAHGLILKMWCLCHLEGHCPSDPVELARKLRCPLAYVSQYKSLCDSLFESHNGLLFGTPPSSLYDSVVQEVCAVSGVRKRKHISNHVRRAVFQRDANQCVKCGTSERLELDHVIPHSKGGSDLESNLHVMCLPHNRAKRDRA